jgi:tetratricopeptide (TPR) repeat protein
MFGLVLSNPAVTVRPQPGSGQGAPQQDDHVAMRGTNRCRRGTRQAAETTRQAALGLGTEADHAEVRAWAHEIRAWIDLTTGNYHGVVAAARTGIEAAPRHSVAIQLAAQEAKAWARIGDRRNTEVALDKGRRLLEAMPYPDNLDHHFVVDPTKFDFYAMDCYRHLAEDRLAETLATEVIQASTDFDGTERAPMRLAEARVTLGVVAARQGDLEQAIHYGERALSAPRKSLPSLLMVSRDLTRVLNDQYQDEPETQAYLDQLHALSSLRIHCLLGLSSKTVSLHCPFHINTIDVLACLLK